MEKKGKLKNSNFIDIYNSLESNKAIKSKRSSFIDIYIKITSSDQNYIESDLDSKGSLPKIKKEKKKRSEIILKLSLEKTKKIIDLYKSGLSIRQIHKETGVGPETISTTLKAKNIEIRTNHKLPEETRVKMIEMYENGSSFADIHRSIGKALNFSTVRTFLKRKKIDRLVEVKSRGKTHQITDEQKKEIAKIYIEEKYGLQKIGRIFGISNESVERILKLQGVPIRTSNKNVVVTAKQKELAVSMYKEGKGVYEIHKALKLSRKKVESILNENRIFIKKFKGLAVIDNETCNKIVDLFRTTEDTAFIAKEVKIDEKKVVNFLIKNKYLKKQEDDYTPVGYTQEIKDKIIELYNSGMDLMTVSKQLGISYFTTYKYAKFRLKKENTSKEFTNIDEAAKDPRKVYCLRLENCDIDSIPDIVFSFHNLDQLTITGGLIKEIPDGIKNLTKLRTLNLSSNTIETISPYIKRLKKLETLNLSENKLDILPTEFKELQSLENLDLSFNALKKVYACILSLSNLKHLNITGNDILRLPLDIDRLDRLQIFEVKKNYLGSLPNNIGKLKNLEIFDLSSNRLETLPEQIVELKALRFLYMKENSLYNLSKKQKDFLLNLEDVFIDKELESLIKK